jgi:pyruvate/2-oxoglutarate dehydrogenase complex dihydrolipoamide dehydrogenase (E3) component
VGSNESEARQQGIRYRVARMPAEGVFRARTISETRGFLKMLIGDHGNRILGFTAFITGGGDLIAVVQTAMLSGLEFPALRDAIFTQPTMPEGVNLLLSNVEVRQPEMLQNACLMLKRAFRARLPLTEAPARLSNHGTI